MSISTTNQKVDQKKYGDNFDRIDWGTKKQEKTEPQPKEKKGCCRKQK